MVLEDNPLPTQKNRNITYLILAPSPASTGRRVLAVVLCDTVLVAFHNVRCRRIHGRVHGHCHGRRHDVAGDGVQRIEVDSKIGSNKLEK